MSRTVVITPAWQVSIWNGTARLSESVAESLSMLGRDVVVITPAIPNGGAYRRWLDGIQVKEVADYPKGMWKANIEQAFKSLRNIEEVFVIDAPPWNSVSSSIRELGISTIGIALFGQSVQGERIASSKTDVLITEEDAFITGVQQLLVNNEIFRSRIKTVFGREVGKLEMSASPAPEIDLVMRTDIKKDPGSVLVVGKIGPEMGVEKVIRAMPDLPWLKLKIMGMPRSEWEMTRLSFLIERLGVGDRVYFEGYKRTRDVLVAIRSAELVVVPSIVEYFGYSAMDAMLMKTPVIASTTNIHIEIIQDGETGYCFQNLDELKYALNTLHESEELRNYLSDNALAEVKERRNLKFMANSLATLIGV